jgi:hypothetical protein
VRERGAYLCTSRFLGSLLMGKGCDTRCLVNTFWQCYDFEILMEERLLITIALVILHESNVKFVVFLGSMWMESPFSRHVRSSETFLDH